MTIIEKMLSMTSQENMGAVIEFYTDENYHKVNMTEHLKTWASNKEHIFQLFGEQLKIEMPVETQLPYTMVQKKLKDFIENELKETKFNLISVFLRAISPEEISGNAIRSDFRMFDTVFKKGIKVSKCFRQLTKKEWVEEAIVKYSMFLQSLKAKGTAVLSIDPIDFLTMSANNSGWRSCHAPDGEYRAGQIAYMMDGVSVISYVKSSEDCEIKEGVVHANKIWRQICLINDDNTYALQARQYPAINDANALTVGKMLQGAIEKWTSKSYNRFEMDCGNPSFRNLQVSHDGQSLYYNDIEQEAFENGFAIIPADQDKDNFYMVVESESRDYPLIKVGADVPCLCGCGDWLEDGEHYFTENNCCNSYDYDEY